MTRLRFVGIILFVLLLFVMRVAAQAQDCPALVASAFSATEELCQEAGRNEICYGNINLEAEGQPDAPAITFDSPGDIENISSVRTLRLDGMNVDAAVWGIALMRVQANLSDSDPAQNVTMVLFGDVSIDNQSPATTTLSATVSAAENANVRLSPSATAPVLLALPTGTQISVTGRDASGEWLRVRLDGQQGGWIFNELLTVAGDISTLQIVEAGPYTPEYGPMQAFIMQTGVDDSPCAEAPSSGILVQTPEGVGEVNLLINEVDIRLGSTAYISTGRNADGSNRLGIRLIEGNARIEANGVAQFLLPGQQLDVPLSNDFTASGQPGDPQPYDGSGDPLPFALLPRFVETPEPFFPDPSAPVITRVERFVLGPTRTREDIFFTDLEGNVVQLNIDLQQISDRGISYRFIGTQVALPAEQQQSGAILSRETICTEGTAGVDALFRITLEDAAGLVSNIVEYRTQCGR
ncbi:MAG: SH3 domain-containing protein [Chloroflexi bacterium]|nr:SH3 domain-containing protein [Chloroflexota bacterium]